MPLQQNYLGPALELGSSQSAAPARGRSGDIGDCTRKLLSPGCACSISAAGDAGALPLQGELLSSRSRGPTDPPGLVSTREGGCAARRAVGLLGDVCQPTGAGPLVLALLVPGLVQAPATAGSFAMDANRLKPGLSYPPAMLSSPPLPASPPTLEQRSAPALASMTKEGMGLRRAGVGLAGEDPLRALRQRLGRPEGPSRWCRWCGEW